MTKTKMRIFGGSGLVGVLIQGLRNVTTEEFDILMHTINVDVTFAEEASSNRLKFLCTRAHAEMIGNWFRDRGHSVTE